MQFAIIEIRIRTSGDTSPPDFAASYYIWMLILGAPGLVMLVVAGRFNQRDVRKLDAISKENSGLESKKPKLTASKWTKSFLMAIIAVAIAVIVTALLVSNPIHVQKLVEFLENSNRDIGPDVLEIEDSQSNYDSLSQPKQYSGVSPEFLESGKIPDANVVAIWVRFTSNSGRAYTAVHVFGRPNYPYIKLDNDFTNGNQDEKDFELVLSSIATHYKAEHDRISTFEVLGSGTMSAIIQVQGGLTQKDISQHVRHFYQEKFDGVAVDLYYKWPKD